MVDLDTRKAFEYIRNAVDVPEVPRMAIVLGSGWGTVVETVVDVVQEVPYADIPGFPVSTVEGHAGQLIFGYIAGVPVWIMQGRFHYYEGYSMKELTFPVRVLASLGIKGLILTNAAGGIEAGFKPGQLMFIEDHINLMGANPLRGKNDDAAGPRFPDMTHAWDVDLLRILTESADTLAGTVQKGIYLAVSGPNFETPAEIRAFAGMGAHAVGMSTVPECIVARHCGLRVAGISCITNVAAHAGGQPLTHEEVSVTAQVAQESIASLFSAVMPLIHHELSN